LAVAAVFAASLSLSARADAVSDFYTGKEVTFLVGGEPGGGYDTFARLIARHYSAHLPGRPNIVVKNMPGAGSMTMSHHVANVAPKDGTVLGAPQNGVAVEQLLRLLAPDGTAGRFDAKAVNWIGTPTQDVFLLLAWHESKVKTFSDLMTTELVIGAEGPGTDGSVSSKLLNMMLGTKIKTITGYQGSGGRELAVERGEVQGDATSYSTLMTRKPEWVRDGKVRILVQMAVEKSPLLPEVPFVLDLVKSPDDRKIMELVFSKLKVGRPLFAAPGVPTDRVAALRAAFDATMKDPGFLEDAKKARVHVEPASGVELQALVARLIDTPEALATKTREILSAQ
jgi:tripartite-type tricarboxylate transporter receptor subunit TctC